VAAPPNKDIVDAAAAADSFKSLVAAAKAAGLVDTLKGPGAFSVFAPSDETFAKRRTLGRLSSQIEKGSEMTAKQLQRYKKALSEKAAELLDALRDRGLIAIECTPEECERIVLASQRELAVVTFDRHSRLLREVKAAMAGIEDDSYGVCENCEEAITPKRLDAVPWARYCVQCQESIDRGPNPTAQFAQQHVPMAA
jgi:DnaK suppressor protein